MLTKETHAQIISLIKQSPMSMQELAKAIDKNWRTTDTYVEKIIEDTGLLSTKIFRPGSRGALKLVYYNAAETLSNTAYQDRLYFMIKKGTVKHDFSPLDIYQMCDENKRTAIIEQAEFSPKEAENYNKILHSAQDQLLIFSGNMSWVVKNKESRKIIEKLLKRNVKVKILTRIDVSSDEVVEELLEMNKQIKSDNLEIRHCQQPVRGMILDSTLLSLKEVINYDHYKKEKEIFVFYRIKDQLWISWMTKVFWNLWNQSVDANVRITALKTILKE